MSICVRCGAGFSCGMTDDASGTPCWCAALPVLPASAYVTKDGTPGGSACFCPACLRALLETERTRRGHGDNPFP